MKSIHQDERRGFLDFTKKEKRNEHSWTGFSLGETLLVSSLDRDVIREIRGNSWLPRRFAQLKGEYR